MNDDTFSRRGALRRFSFAVGGAALAGCVQGDDDDSGPGLDDDDASPDDDDATADDDDSGQDSCTLAPQQTQGPFWFDAGLVRSDIREDRQGLPIELTLTVVDALCRPIRDAVVEIWHADGAGLYSGYTGQGHNGNVDTSGQTFLRGIQVSDSEGQATFQSIYPGWYPGRATHMHFKVHIGKETLVTSQLYFPDTVSDRVHTLEPYAVWGPSDTTNAEDNFGGDDPIVLTSAEDKGDRVVARLLIAVAGG